MLMTAAICSGASVRPGLTATTMEADDLSPSLDTNEVDLAIDRCTRAEAMASIVGDALRQLAFEAAAEAHVLHELRHAQRVILVHQFRAGR